MDAGIKTQWLEALRSGEYQQGRGELATMDANGKKTHCCLGVLCELAVKAGIVQKTDGTWNEGSLSFLFDNSNAVLPTLVKNWAGLLDHNPGIVGIQTPRGYKEFSLAELNDGSKPYELEPYNFTQIANIIEEIL